MCGQRWGKWGTVGARPCHSHFPKYQTPRLTHKDWNSHRIPLFLTVASVPCLCVCLCVDPAVFASRGGKISSLLPGQTFPVCKHWRARDIAVSWHARVNAHICAHAQLKHNLCPSGWLTFSHSGSSSRANNCRHNSHLLDLYLSLSHTAIETRSFLLVSLC